MKHVTLMFCCLLLVACDQGETPISLGTLEVDRIELTAETTEPIVEVAVTEGTPVAVGDVLLRQDTARARLQLKQAMADLDVVRAQLAEAEAGPRAQDIAAARAKVAAAESDVRTLAIELQRERSLMQQRYASQNSVDILEGRYESAVARQQEADALLGELVEGTRSEAVDAARSRFAVAAARVEDIEVTLARADIRSPVDGTVEAVITELGERPRPGVPVVVIARTQVPYARVHVSEVLRNRLAPGASAVILIDGYDNPLKGRLRWIAHDASYTPYFSLTQHDRGHLSYLAEVDIDPGFAPTVATGIPVEVRFPDIE